ncbi:MAG: WD40 repeat domain-containing protein, partial [Chloroflexi bacterium]|nr:WD40 repeat domain-containing protein [Chloroflexota bacterium]
ARMNWYVKVWDLETGEMVRQLQIVPDVGGMAFSSDSRLLAIADSSQCALVWDFVADQVRRLPHPSSVWSVTFSPDGTFLATSGVDETITLWDLTTNQAVRTLEGNQAVFTQDGTRLVAIGTAGVQEWDLGTGKELYFMSSPSRTSRDFSFSPDGARATYYLAETVWVLDCAVWQARPILGHYSGRGEGLAFSPDGRLLVTTNYYGALILWSLADGQVLHLLETPPRYMQHLVFSPDGQKLAADSQNGFPYVRLWDMSTGQELQSLAKDPERAVYGLAFSPDGQTLFGLDGSSVVLWDMATGRMGTLGEPAEDLQGLATSPDGRWLAVSNDKGIITLWDLQTRQVIHAMATGRGGANVIAFSRDGKELISSGGAQGCRVWDTSNGQLLRAVEGSYMASSPDGSLWVLGRPDRSSIVWDAVAAREVYRLPPASSVTFSPDGSRLALHCADGVVSLWGVQ